MASNSRVSFRPSGDPSGAAVGSGGATASSGGRHVLGDGSTRSAGGKFPTSCLGSSVCMLGPAVLDVSGDEGEHGSPNKSLDIISADDASADSSRRTGGEDCQLALLTCTSTGASLSLAVVSGDAVKKEVVVEEGRGLDPSDAQCPAPLALPTPPVIWVFP